MQPAFVFVTKVLCNLYFCSRNTQLPFPSLWAQPIFLSLIVYQSTRNFSLLFGYYYRNLPMHPYYLYIGYATRLFIIWFIRMSRPCNLFYLSSQTLLLCAFLCTTKPYAIGWSYSVRSSFIQSLNLVLPSTVQYGISIILTLTNVSHECINTAFFL